MDFYRVNKILVYLGLFPIILYIIRGGSLSLGVIFILPIIALAVKPSFRTLGISLAVASIVSCFITSNVIQLSSVIISAISILFSVLSLRQRVLPLVGLAGIIALSIFFHPSLFLVLLASSGLLFSLFDKPLDPSGIFTLAIPYFVTQVLFLVLYSFYVSPSFWAINLFGELSRYAYLAYAVVIITFALYLLRKDYAIHMYVNALISAISIALGSVLAYLFVSPFSIMFGISGSMAVAFTFSQRDLGNIIIEAFKRNDLRLAERVSSIYEGDLTEVYKKLVDMKLCNAVVKLPEFRPYKINYLDVDYTKVAECFLELKQVPVRDVINYLRFVKEKDINLAEKVGRLALDISPSPKLVNIMKEIEVLKLDYLKYNWDPEIWIGNELYGYKIISYLGKGGSSYVLVGEKEGKRYAIKIPILMPPSTSSSSYYDFVNEYSQLRDLSQRSDNIVKFVDARIDSFGLKKILSGDVVAYMKEPPILVMEFMEGGSAKSLMNDNNVFYSDLWWKIVALIGYEMASALKAIHEMGFVHLDIKPSNILFSKQPGKTGKEVLEKLVKGEVKVKLSDLGSARKRGERFIQYTPEYCPIDQVEALFKGEGAQFSMDIYSLGATLYTLLTRQPFNPREVVSQINDAELLYKDNKDPLPSLQKAKEIYVKFHEAFTVEEPVDRRLVELIKSMTSPEPEKRPSALEVYKRLEEIINNNEGSSSTG
ncbi:protein kinase domain-containing protein [Stygiolobus caldivivus]|uniref:Serine/threonine protein kinase n=1 Tax=Stygiolobus caldivivus TaxID=2824673 RepID=A0A8D5ZGK4_9CREN|nr:protein kinase [Stygiolobus caldivivus]BCU71023.1 serine/threonine protein kinase [Stygiolobus caldivivus]